MLSYRLASGPSGSMTERGNPELLEGVALADTSLQGKASFFSSPCFADSSAQACSKPRDIRKPSFWGAGPTCGQISPGRARPTCRSTAGGIHGADCLSFQAPCSNCYLQLGLHRPGALVDEEVTTRRNIMKREGAWQ